MVTHCEWGGSVRQGRLGVLVGEITSLIICVIGYFYGWVWRCDAVYSSIHGIPELIPPLDTATQYSSYPSYRALPRHNHTSPVCPSFPQPQHDIHIPLPINHFHKLPPPPNHQTKRSTSQSPSLPSTPHEGTYQPASPTPQKG